MAQQYAEIEKTKIKVGGGGDGGGFTGVASAVTGFLGVSWLLQVTKMVLVVVILFFLSWLPLYAILCLVKFPGNDEVVASSAAGSYKLAGKRYKMCWTLLRHPPRSEEEELWRERATAPLNEMQHSTAAVSSRT